jgi:hypothetical protein
MESIAFLVVMCMMESGKMVWLMGMASACMLKIRPCMKVNGKAMKDMVKVHMYCHLVSFTKVNGKQIRVVVKVNVYMIMAISMRANGRTIRDMAKARIHGGVMDQFTSATGKTVNQ